VALDGSPPQVSQRVIYLALLDVAAVDHPRQHRELAQRRRHVRLLESA
jgi:hypothetical protein